MTIDDADGMFALIGRVMERARLDAKRGDREAIAFLKITTGESPMTDTTKLQEAVEQAEAAFWRLHEEFEGHKATMERAVNAKDIALVRSLKQRGDELPQLIIEAAEDALLTRLALAEANNRRLSDAYKAAKTKVEALQRQRDELLAALVKLETEQTGLMSQSLGAQLDTDNAQEAIDGIRRLALGVVGGERTDKPVDIVESARFWLFGRRARIENETPTPGMVEQVYEATDVLREKYGLPRIDPSFYTPRPEVWAGEAEKVRR